MNDDNPVSQFLSDCERLAAMRLRYIPESALGIVLDTACQVFRGRAEVLEAMFNREVHLTVKEQQEEASTS